MFENTMNKKLIYIVTLLSLMILSGCGDKFSGKSEEDYKASKLVIESKLDASEKIELEKALRVVVMHAMQVKWDEAEKYKGQSFDDITLDVVDNKTYNGVIDFAENYLKNNNKIKAEELKGEIAKLETDKQEASKTIEMLALIKTKDIRIVEEESHGETIPYLIVTLTNTTNYDLIDAYKIDVNVNSISKKINLNVDGVGLGGGHTIQKGGTLTEKHSLIDLMALSKRLSSKLENAVYPITDLAPLDLEVNAKAAIITTSDGNHYEYPQKNIAYFDNEIEKTKKELLGIESLEGKLSELELTDSSSETSLVFNEKYVDEINLIRIKSNSIKHDIQLVKIDDNLSITLPKAYKIVKRHFSGRSAISFTDDLTFDSQDENLLQFQIIDTAYREYIPKSDKAHGQFRALYKPDTNYNIKETIEEIKTPINTLVEADDSGYITLRSDTYSFIRYFEIKGTHYLYSLDFTTLEECIIEFDRSKNMVRE